MKKFGLLFSILILASQLAWGQILTFEFSALAGDEASANSNFNDANLISSTITRGSGVTAATNAQRFNSSSWSTGSIDLNDYVEFTITPNAGKKFSITSVVMLHQRSGTGPTSFVLRTSSDGYTTDLGGVQTIGDVATTQTSTFTFSVSDQTTALTIRIYAYTAEALGGTWGPGDGTGNDLIINGSTDDISLVSNASNFIVTYALSTEIQLSWTNDSNSDGVIIVAKQGSAVDVMQAELNVATVDNNDFSNNGNFTAANQDMNIDYGVTTASNNILVYSGTGTNITITNLTVDQVYYFRIFNDYGLGSSGTNWSTGVSANATTADVELIDSFTDGDFTSNPAWSGSTSSWQIVTDSDAAAGATNSFTLRLNAPAVSQTEYLSVQRTGTWGNEQSWGFWLGRRVQNSTDANHSLIWLFANESDLLSSTVDGYRIKYGDNTTDKVILQRIDNSTSTNILSSSGSGFNGTDYGFLIRVTRTSTGLWTLYTSAIPSANGTGSIATDIPLSTNTTITQGTTIDNTYSSFDNGYLGFAALHSTGADAIIGAEFDQLYFSKSIFSPLPVELSSFSASVVGNAVKLNWITETEVNNYGFDIERKVGSLQSTVGNYEKVGFVNGNGNSNSPKSYSFEDKNVTAGKYSYRLKQIDNDGQFEYSKTIEVDLGAPKKFELSQNYPNPFNPVTTIRFNLPEAGNVKLTLFNILGQELKTLVNGFKESGVHTINFDASELNSGMYIYKIEAGNFVQTRKMTLVK